MANVAFSITVLQIDHKKIMGFSSPTGKSKILHTPDNDTPQNTPFLPLQYYSKSGKDRFR